MLSQEEQSRRRRRRRRRHHCRLHAVSMADSDPASRPRPRLRGGDEGERFSDLTLPSFRRFSQGASSSTAPPMDGRPRSHQIFPDLREEGWEVMDRTIATQHHETERCRTGAHVRQSVMYSNRIRRPRHTQRPAPTEMHPNEASNIELHLPTFETLSITEPLTFQISEESDGGDDDDDGDDPHYKPVGFVTLGPQTLRSSVYPPRPKWLGGVRGQAKLEEHAGDAASSGELGPTASVLSKFEAVLVGDSAFTPQSTEEKCTKDLDYDPEETLRLATEYLDAHPTTSMSQAFYEMRLAAHDTVVALAAKWGRPPPPPPRKPPLVDQETQSPQAGQQSFAAIGHPQHSTTPKEPRKESSTEEIIANGKKWMLEEVMVVFKIYNERRDNMIIDYRFGELRHQCMNVESFNSVFHHYNFTVRMKDANLDDWVDVLYFAEVKKMFGRKYYFCCRLEEDENGECYACQSKGVEDLQHPATGGFETGFPDVGGFDFWYPDLDD